MRKAQSPSSAQAPKRGAKRRGNGEGSIYKRKSDGKWVGDFTIGWRGAKRIRKVVVGNTRQEVRDKIAALQNGKAAGTLADSGGIIVNQYLDHWLENIARPTIRATSYVSYKGIVNTYLKPHLGRHRLDKLSPVHVQTMQGDLEREGEKSRLSQLIHATLRRALNIAVKQGLVARNVCTAIDPPKVEKTTMKTMTAEQARALLQETEGTPEHALFVLAISCGLRQGELFGLHWSDIDMSTGRLSVRHTLTECSGVFRLGPPKSRSGIRSIRLPDIAIEALKDHQKIKPMPVWPTVIWYFVIVKAAC